MCRLLGTVSRTPVTLDEVLGDGRPAFLALASKHGDGWGHAWSDGERLEVRKAPESALTSTELEALSSGQRSRAALTHLRWATLGLSVQQVNTHPFSDGTVAFAHNGSIAPPQALDPLVSSAVAGMRQGDTDSERYFLAVLSRMAEGATPVEALAATVRDVHATGARVHSLNALLLTPSSLLAVCSYDPASYEEQDYYPLLFRTEGDAVVVASTGWTDSAGWSVLSDGQLLEVDRTSLATTVHDVAGPHGVGLAS